MPDPARPARRADPAAPTGPRARRARTITGTTGGTRVVAPVAALVGLGLLTGWLGAAVHLARVPVLGVLVPHGVLLALAFVLACDVAVAAAALGRRPGPGRALLAVAAGRGLAVGVLLLPRPEGDLVLTGLPASTAWILLSVLVPAFAAPMATAVGLPRRPRGATAAAAAR